MDSKALKQLSLRDLATLRQRIDKLMAAKKRQLSEARAKIARIAREVGCSARDLVDLRKKGAAPRREKPVPPKYVNPSDPEQTWNGKGRHPGWLAKAIKSGKAPESFLSH